MEKRFRAMNKLMISTSVILPFVWMNLGAYFLGMFKQTFSFVRRNLICDQAIQVWDNMYYHYLHNAMNQCKSI